ncbi:twin-arginine translocase subunit TatB [Amycolatopsis sp. CA-128772]|uniref:twin-arginine translocase subunit TatB n=1 Tax=Amycolatopsis sp. CA-128772 TaxID=2073159 RepID=UPI000CD0B761|nr:twin-arginine translocase subunit TatB [Amycolatopsis sp. CA-128772]
MLGLSPEHLLVLLDAALFILGPERLPDAIATVRTTAQKAKNGLANAHDEQISSEIGPEFEQLREPLGELGRHRGLDPRHAVSPAAAGHPARRVTTGSPVTSPTTPRPGDGPRVDMEAA